jgi:hypothetical protein
MKRSKEFLAFGLGCLTAISLSFAIKGTSQVKKPGNTNPLENRLKVLEQRAALLELGSTVSQAAKKVTAPFLITNPAGIRIFDVTSEGVKIYFGDKPMATMGGSTNGGSLVAVSALTQNKSLRFDASLGSPGFSFLENDKTRIDLGRALEKGTYRLKVLSTSDQLIAGIGENKNSPTGLAVIADSLGNVKARMAVGDGDKGVVDVLGINKSPIAQLTEGSHKGGRLLICQPDNCDPPMIDAGGADGYGIVRAGPLGFNPGSTMFGLPASVLVGKRD